MFREKLRLRVSQMTDVAIIAFLVSMTAAITSPVFPVFAEKISGRPELVGIIASVYGLSAIFINIYIARFFEKDGVLKNLRIGLLLFSLVFASYILISSPLALAAAQIILAAAVCFGWTALSILVKNSSNRQNLGESEGEYFTFVNFGVLVGVLLGGAIAMSSSYNAVFLYAALIFLATYFLSKSMGIKDGLLPHNDNAKIDMLQEAKRFFKDRKLRAAYIANVGLYIWTSASLLYIPIIMKSLGFDFQKIGIILAVMIAPYLMLEYPVGKLAEKHGSSAFISAGFFAIALASVLIYLNFGAILSMIFFFFLSFMGAAAIEPLNEMNLNAHSNKKRIFENMAIFKTSLRLAYFLGPLFAGLFISLFGIKGMFLAFAVIMAGFWWAVSEKKDPYWKTI